jgi:hypothetical protein
MAPVASGSWLTLAAVARWLKQVDDEVVSRDGEAMNARLDGANPVISPANRLQDELRP